MRRILTAAAAILFMAGVQPVWAQQSEIAALRAELAAQQAVIAQLLERLQVLEKKQQPALDQATVEADLQEDINAQEDSINSLREIVNSKAGAPERPASSRHHPGRRGGGE
jgi:hypothetical protein